MVVGSTEDAAEMLNRLLERDPDGVSRFFMMFGMVSRDTADLPFELAESALTDSIALFPIGLINGLVSEQSEAGTRRVSIEYEDGSYIIRRFYVEDLDRDGQDQPAD